MNFRVSDTSWFIGVSFSLLAFLLGLFSGVAISSKHVFLINLMLFITSASILLVGIGLLLAATEVFVSKRRFPDNHFVRFIHKSYQVMTGRSHDVLSSPEHDDESDKWIESDINTRYLTPEEIVAASYLIEKYAHSTLSIPSQPVNKPIIHQENTLSPEVDMLEKEVSLMDSSDRIGEATEDQDVVSGNNIEILSSISIYGIIWIGEGGLHPSSDEFKELLKKSLLEYDVNDAFRLRLQGKTYGLGARGVKVIEDGETFIAYNKNDVKKMLKKFSIVGASS